MSVFVAASVTPAQAFELARAIREPSDYQYDSATSTATITFTPDLTAAETATLSDMVGAYHTRDLSLTLAEYRAIKPDLAGLRTYAGIASPTLAQTVSAVKAQSRILRALLRD